MNSSQPIRHGLALLTLAALGLSSIPAQADSLFHSWTRQHDLTATIGQGASALAFDSRGNLVAAGYAKTIAGVDQLYVAKYDGLDGHILWTRLITDNAPSRATSVAIDAGDDVIVTGSTSPSGDSDLFTAKYDGADGNPLWSVTYDGTAGGLDEGVKVVVDSAKDVYVTARSAGSAAGVDFYTAKYASLNGSLLWDDRYSTSGTRDDVPADLAIDGSNNVIIVGEAKPSGTDSLYVRKLNANGTFAWDKTINAISGGSAAGARGVALDSLNNVFVTALFRNTSNHRGYYTVKFSSGGTQLWSVTRQPLTDDFIGGPTDIAVGPDGNPVVTGSLKDTQGNENAFTVKYASTQTGAILGSVLDPGLADPVTGVRYGDCRGRAVTVDALGNICVVGESDNKTGNSTSEDIYLARFNPGITLFLDQRFFVSSRNTDDRGFAVAVDPFNNVGIAGYSWENLNNNGFTRFTAVKFSRFAARIGDALPSTALLTNPFYAGGSSPVVSDNGALAALVTAKTLKTQAAPAKTATAIYVEGGDNTPALVAEQKGTAPGVTGATFASFNDPIVSPDGHYAFAAKLAGVPGANATTVWNNLGGTLHLALQQGKPVPPFADNLASVMSLSLRNTRMVALVKLASPAATSTALVALTSANAGTKLMRTGDSVTVNNVASTIRTLTVLSPTTISLADGRWHGDTDTVVLATLADKRTVVYRVSTAGTATAMLFTGGDASGITGVTGAKWKAFSKPAVGSNAGRYTLLATFTGNTPAANDTALLYSANGTTFTAFVKEGGTPNDSSLNTLTYSAFSEPLASSTLNVGFLATLRGAGVTPKNNRALLFGPAGATHRKIARLGDKATDAAGNLEASITWSSFTAFSLTGGPAGTPLFVARLAGPGVNARNGLGLWAVDSTGKVRRLLRVGDLVDGVAVTGFTILRSLPTVFAAPRGFGATSVGVQVTLADKTTALLQIPIP